MMYSSRITGPRALVALGVFLVLGPGCAELKKTDAVKGPGTRASAVAHTETPPESLELDQLRDQIAKLERDLEFYKKQDDWNIHERARLQEGCGEGFNKRNGSARFQVSTADTPEGAIRAVNEIYAAEGIEPHDNTPPEVKTVRLPFGKKYPDIVCFEFGNQSGDTTPPGRTCFDPMEITER